MALLELLIPVVSIVFGILVITSKRMLRYIVGGYFFIVGLIGILEYLL